jgi:hypothetical protein
LRWLARGLVAVGVVAAIAAGGTAGAASYGEPPTTRLGEGAWSWFSNPRAIVTGGGCEVIASAAAGVNPIGRVEVMSRYPQTSASDPRPRRTVTVDRTLTADDHNNGSLLKLANGEILVAWSGHAQDKRIRVAVRAAGTRRWTRLAGFTSSKKQTYNNLFQLSDGTVLDFTRGSGPATPRVYRSSDNGRAWSHFGELLRWSGDSVDHRPYLQYVQSGDRIWFLATLGHPELLAFQGYDSPVYAGYLEGTAIHRSDGTVAGSLNGRVEVDDLTLVYEPPAGHSAWTSNLTVDASGNPVGVLSVRDRTVADTSPSAVRYVQARWNGAWSVHDVAPGGRALYTAEPHYSGTIAGDPGDPNHVVISSTVDPTTSTDLGQFELFDGRTLDGVTWTWTRLTTTPKKDDLRPFLTARSVNGMQALLWFQGRYTTYTVFTTDVKYRLLNPNGVACP